MAHLASLDSTIQKTHQWLKEVGAALGYGSERTWHAALRATLHALRDCLPVDEMAQLGAQLPTIVRGVYYEGWNPDPGGRRDHPGFVEQMRAQLKDHPELRDVERVARAVLSVLVHHVSHGEIEQVIHAVPHEVRPLLQPAAPSH